MAEYTVGSCFSGAGGMDLGFEQAGFTIAWQIENDSDAQSVLHKHWPNTALYEDIRTLDPAYLAPVDVIIGGWPCQDHSIAGKRKGFDGDRSNLFFDLARIVAQVRPRCLVLENVPGLLSQTGDFHTVIRTLDNLGYVGAWRVLDLQFFRTAQRRRRIFFVASLGTSRLNPATILFESESSSRCAQTSKAPKEDIAATLGSSTDGRGWNSDTDRMTFVPIDIARCLSTRNERINGESETFVVTNSIQTSAGHHGHSSPRGDGSDNLVASVDLVNVTSKTNRTRVTFDAPSNTLHTGGLAAIDNRQQYAVRRLTPRECERLQGWTDDHTRYTDDGKELSDSVRYRLIGNGCGMPVAAWIAKRLYNELERI